MTAPDPAPSLHHRRSIRLNGYDYARPGAYFITICTHNRACLFGEIVTDPYPGMILNEYGQIVRQEWQKSAEIRAEIELAEWVIMPNHFHAIVWIVEVGDTPVYGGHAPVGAYGHTPLPQKTLNSPSKTIGALVRGFKSAVTKRINILRGTPAVPVWQRNYWEHIIRSDSSYKTNAEYILSNPQEWSTDRLYPGSQL